MKKNLNRHYKKKDNNSLNKLNSSYSYAKIDDSENTKGRFHLSVKKRTVKISIIILACVLFLFLAINKDNLSPGNVTGWISGIFLGASSGKGYPANISGTSISPENFELLNGDIAYVSDTSFVIMNPSANIIVERQHSFARPILECKNNYSLIYNLGGKGYQIEKKDKNILKSTTEYNIVSGAISESGEYAFIMESKDYLSEMIVYNEKNEQKYKYYFSEYYITDVALKDNGNFGAVSGVYSENGVLKSVVYLFDFSSETPKAVFEYEDTMILSLEYTSNNNLVVVGDCMVSMINTSKCQNHDYSFENKDLTAFEINQKGAALSLSSASDRRNCEVVVVGFDGKAICDIETDDKIRSVSVNDNLVAVLTDSQIVEYNYNGKRKKSSEASNDLKKIKLYSGSKAYVLGVVDIDLVHLT